MGLKQEFLQKNAIMPWQRLKFWWMFRRVKQTKQFSLWEGLLDRLFFETKMTKWLEYSDVKDREALVNEAKKPVGTQDPAKRAEIEERIAMGKAVKESYRRTLNFINEINQYLDMIREWEKKD